MSVPTLIKRLDLLFSKPFLEIPAGTLYGADRDLDLDSLAPWEEGQEEESTPETDDEEYEEGWTEGELKLFSGIGPGLDILRGVNRFLWTLLCRHGSAETFLRFLWFSGGPMSSAASLKTLDLGLGKRFLCFWEDTEDMHYVLAALEPKGSDLSSLYTTFVHNVLHDNGIWFGHELFGSLPSITENYRPDLVSRETLEECYLSWMQDLSDSRPSLWSNLEEYLLLMAENPSPLIPASKLAGLIQEIRNRDPREEIELMEDEETCRKILELYFWQTYREPKPGAGLFR